MNMTANQIVTREYKPVEIKLIDIADDNVRTEQQNRNLDDLKTSIERVCLIHPVLLISKKNGRYDLLV